MFSSSHKKSRFPLRISSVQVTKSAGNSGFGSIYPKKSLIENLIFVQCLRRYKEQLPLKEKQPLEVFCKKGVVIDFAGKHRRWSFFLTKLPSFRSATLWKRDSSRGAFLAKLEKFLIALILKNIWKLLPLLRYRQKGFMCYSGGFLFKESKRHCSYSANLVKSTHLELFFKDFSYRAGAEKCPEEFLFNRVAGFKSKLILLDIYLIFCFLILSRFLLKDRSSHFFYHC